MSQSIAMQVLRSISRSLTIPLKHCGISLPEVIQAFTEAYSDKDLPIGNIDNEGIMLTAYKVDVCSRMMHLWREDADYLDEMGETKKIRIAGGSPSVQNLYQRTVAFIDDRGENFSEVEAIQVLTENDNIRVNKDGTVSQLGLGLRTASSSTGALIQLGYVESLATTAANNLIYGGRWHLESRVRNFPISKLSLLERTLDEKGLRAIEEVDAFMEQQRDRRLPHEQVVDVGVCLFRFERRDGAVGPAMNEAAKISRIGGREDG